MNIQTITLLFTLLCTGCGSQLAITGKERTEYLRSIKPYGAHWIKEGMTRESRRADFVDCGGAMDLREGYPRNPALTSQEFFAGFKVHVNQIAACMRGKSYQYQSECNERCLHP